MGLADEMPDIREEVFGLIGDVAVLDDSTATEVKGKFFKRYREVQLPDGNVSGLDLSFDCNVSADILALEDGDTITIAGTEYRLRRRFPRGADESGLITLELKA